MGRVDLERARARLAAETREIEQALARRGHEDDGDDAGRLEHRNLAAILYLDELERLAEELRDRLAELERAAQCLAADIYGLSVESRHPIPDERFESFPATEQAAEEERAWPRAAAADLKNVPRLHAPREGGGQRLAYDAWAIRFSSRSPSSTTRAGVAARPRS